jgi:hypothetical protein
LALILSVGSSAKQLIDNIKNYYYFFPKQSQLKFSLVAINSELSVHQNFLPLN